MFSEIIWNIKPSSPLAGELAGQAGITPFLAQLLINRGISDKADAGLFLDPRLAHLPDPMLFMDMQKAVSLIIGAIEKGEKITVFGDYDADGITATTLLLRFFSSLGVPADYYIPDRLGEGYGLNREAVKKIHARGTRLIITVDCGISDSAEIVLAKDLGMDMVVTDHHKIPENFLPECPVINPHRKGCPFPFKPLSGVGVAFFLAVAVRGALRKTGRFEEEPEPDLREYLDLVALGTVADRVPLMGLNRTLVKSGIKLISNSKWPGIRAMIDVSGVKGPEISGEDIAFKLAPRINAPGRIDDPQMSMEILNTVDIPIAQKLAVRINAVNNRRQALEKQILDKAENMIGEQGSGQDSRTFILASEEWHRGVLGIVASKLAEKYHRPVLLFSIEDGIAVGSGRSIEGFNLYDALFRIDHLFEKFGGHAMAAGFTINYENLDMLSGELEDLAREMLSDDDLIPSLDIDAEVPTADVGFEMIHQINELAPFGEGNPEPVLLSRSMKVVESRVVGQDHLKLTVSKEGRTFEAIGFGMAEMQPLFGEMLDMVFTPQINRWQGYESVQLRIVDFIKV
ncbi:single-stranded-DNA-specific exonuclease RecJ [Thermodesulfobacteriota bacterium]